MTERAGGSGGRDHQQVLEPLRGGDRDQRRATRSAPPASRPGCGGRGQIRLERMPDTAGRLRSCLWFPETSQSFERTRSRLEQLSFRLAGERSRMASSRRHLNCPACSIRSERRDADPVHPSSATPRHVVGTPARRPRVRTAHQRGAGCAGSLARGSAARLIPALVSFASAMAAPRTRASGSVRSSGCATTARVAWSTGSRTIYYSLTAPAKGGPAAPTAAARPGGRGRGGASTRPRHVVRYYRPRDIRPLIAPACPARASGARRSHGGTPPPVLITSFRPSPATRRWSSASPGSTAPEPRRGCTRARRSRASRCPQRGPEEVPLPLRSRLLATFNSGFKLTRLGRRLRDRRAHLRAACTTARRRSCATATAAST